MSTLTLLLHGFLFCCTVRDHLLKLKTKLCVQFSIIGDWTQVWSNLLDGVEIVGSELERRNDS